MLSIEQRLSIVTTQAWAYLGSLRPGERREMSQLQGVLPALPDIDDVSPISDADRECIQAVRAVLAEHDALSRFGLSLLHEHFDIAPDEIMMEYVDKENRVLTTMPVKAVDHPAENSVQTSWRLDTMDGMQYCERYCQRPYGPNGPHVGGHASI